MNTQNDLNKAVRELTASWWALTTLATAAESGLLDALADPCSAEQAAAQCGADAALVESVLDVLASVGLVQREGSAYCAIPALEATLRGPGRESWTADLRSTLLQGADIFASGRRKALSRGWNFVDSDILEAQGANSGQFAELFLTKLVPMLAGMSERFERGALFLDVGCGVSAISIELCRRSPRLRCVGLDPAPAPLQVARRRVKTSGFAHRIELRQQRVEDMTDSDAFDLAWLPTMFLPEPVLSIGVERVRAALKPGGWVTTGAMSALGDDLPVAVGRMRNVMWGGDRLTSEDLQDRLRARGLTDVHVLPLPTGAARMVAARKGQS